MKYLVTGSTGFFGEHMVKYLCGRNEYVRAFIRTKSKADIFDGYKVDYAYGDLLKPDTIKEAVKDIDIIINLASITPVGHSDKKSFELFNVQTVKNLLDVIKDTDVKKIIHMSTAGVYGENGFTNADENHPLITKGSPYYVTKCQAEKYLIDFSKKNNINYTILRPPVIYGGGKWSQFYTIMNRLDSPGFVPLIRKGKNVMSFIHVQDLAKAICLIAENSNADNKIYNIDSGEIIKFQDFFYIVCDEMNIKRTKFSVPYSLAYIYVYILEIFNGYLNRMMLKAMAKDFQTISDKIREDIGFEADIMLEEGVKTIIEDWKKIYKS